MDKVRGNRTLSGTWGEVWINGDKVFELSKIEMKTSTNREDVQIGIDVDSKLTGLKGEFTLTTRKVFSRWTEHALELQKGIDKRIQIVCKLADPDATGGQIERYSFDNCWLNDIPIINYEIGAIIEEEITGGFTPSDLINLDKIRV